MKLWPNKARKSARALIIQDGKLLVMHRKRYSRITGKWIEYHSIPGGGIERHEKPEQAVVRELKEEMGVDIVVGQQVAYRKGNHFTHYIYEASLRGDAIPSLMVDSEEAQDWASDTNQFIPKWVPVSELTVENLRYYSDYLEIIQKLAAGIVIDGIVQIDAR